MTLNVTKTRKYTAYMCKVYVIINAGGQPVSKKGTGIVHCTAAAMNWRADVTS